MSISLTKRKFYIQLTLLSMIAGWGGVAILHYAMPGHYFSGYPFIPIYFFIFGAFQISMFDACRKYAPQRMLLLYLATKILKMLFSIFFLLAYCLVVREEAKAFLLTFVVYYIVYLIYESWFFFNFELRQKKKKQKKNETDT